MNKTLTNIIHFQPAKAKSFALLILLAFTLAFLLSLVFPAVFETGEARITDQLFRLRYSWFGKETVYPFLVHIVFDDQSLLSLDTSPWDREVYGKIIAILKDAGVDLIAYDIFFQHQSFQEKDELLVRATEEAGNVYYPVILFPRDLTSGMDLHQVSASEKIIRDSLWHPEITVKGNPLVAETMLTPFAELLNRAKGMGHINCTPDRDGISRRFPLVYSYEPGYIPALSLRMICDYLKVPPENIELAFGKYMILKDAHLVGGGRKDIKIPVDNQGRVLINYPAPWKDSFYEISVKDLLSVQEDDLFKIQLKDTLEGSLVLVSDVSVRNKDVGPGVFENLHPYSEILMTIMNMVLTENFLSSLKGFPLFITLICFHFLLWFFSSFFKVKGFFISSLFAPFLYVAFSLCLFIFFHTVPVVLFPCFGFCLYMIFGSVYLYYTKKREADRIIDEVTEERIELEMKNRSLLASIKKKLSGAKVLIRKKIKNKYTRDMLKDKTAFIDIKTNDEKMIKVCLDVEALAPGPEPVLILGETGTGKELIAAAMNTVSGRSGKFITVNIAGKDDHFLNDDLFGHVKGAFTDAKKDRDGYIKTAAGGCLFLDEIGDLNLVAQKKLLRFIDNGEYFPLGSDQVVKSNVKIIAATNKDLEKKIEKGTFRRDLAERLGLRIIIPPLRERLADLPLLLNHFIQKSAKVNKKEELLKTIENDKLPYPSELIKLLHGYAFPGNVRELESMVKEAVAKCSSTMLSLSVFQDRISRKPLQISVFDPDGNRKTFAMKNNLDELVDQIMEYYMETALETANQNRTKAAEILGISRDKIKRYLNKKAKRKRQQ